MLGRSLRVTASAPISSLRQTEAEVAKPVETLGLVPRRLGILFAQGTVAIQISGLLGQPASRVVVEGVVGLRARGR